jgi:hypothetical protein
LPGGNNLCYGIFHGEQQIGMILYSNYVLWRQAHKDAGIPMMLHSNRLVIHPDYCGFGLGHYLSDATAADVVKQGYTVAVKLSSAARVKQLLKNPKWTLSSIDRNLHNVWANKVGRRGRMRVKTYSLKYTG